MGKKKQSYFLISSFPFLIYCPENTPLWQRGDGEILDDVLIAKIPPNLPFPKGGISGIFITFVNQRFTDDSI
jgi:hypothetical protein